ncbi:hypothetical protein BLS_003512 [Venturia inaequalis]|uniref:Uncharacterized protein n=1 Tax=Venturia inaequalis TaxID=5025 RepID=A0A8H3UPW6_VENIN|nr:hypothetical protein BLS_003512 [Venturia inaequalis]RDI86634.1 hypothetical protein Vi05172_g3338 [Venturia inaequalis]
MEAARLLVQRLSNTFNAILPPEKRAAVRDLLQDFAYVYPKLAVFLFLNLALTGLPLLLFVAFALTIFVSSLIAALLGAILITLLITTFAIFAASLLLLPTVFLTTLAASSLYFWGLVAYYIFVHLQKRGATPSDNTIQSTNDLPSDDGEWEHAEDDELGQSIVSTDVVATDNAIPSKDAASSGDTAPTDGAAPTDDTNPSDNAIPSMDHDQSTPGVHSANAMNGKVHDWSGESVSFKTGTTVKPTDRPKVEAKDSAVGLDGIKEKPLQRFDAMASQDYDGGDVDPHMSSLADTIRSELASPAAFKNRKSPRISPTPTPPASTAPRQLFQYAKLRKEHPDGLRQDSKGLFKVDDIASDSSLEEPNREQRLDANQPLRKRSASSFTSMSRDPSIAIQPIKRGQTAIHLPTNLDTGKLNPPAIISQTMPLSMPELERSLDHTKLKTAMLKEGTNPAIGNIIYAPVDPNTAHVADIEDNCDSETSSRKSSVEIERLVDDTTSADEMDFAKMPPTPEDERGASIKSSISPYTGEIVESYFGDQGA